MSPKQNFANIFLARIQNTSNQEGAMERRDEVLGSVGAQDMDTRRYQVSDLDDVELYWENDQLDIDAVSKPSIDTLFSLLSFNDFKMGSTAEKPILIDEEQYKEISPPPHPTTPVSERPTQPPLMSRSRHFGTRIENISDFVWRNLFE